MAANLVRNFCRRRCGLFKKPFFSENELLRMIMNGFLSSLETKARDRNVKSRAFDFMIIAIKMINWKNVVQIWEYQLPSSFRYHSGIR